MKRIAQKPNFHTRLGFIVKFIIALAFLIVSPIYLTAQDPENDDTPIKVDTLLYTIPVTVSNKKGNYVTNLKKEDFTIYEEGLSQKIELFMNENAPMNVAILLDTSISTKGVLDKIQNAARDFVKVLRPEDKALIVGFDKRTLFYSKLESDQKSLSTAIQKVRVSNEGGSDMYEAVKEITDNYFAAIKGRKAIIALTDGIVTGNNFTAQQVIDSLQKGDTFFYPVIFKTEANSRNLKNGKKPVLVEILDIMAEETGGKSYLKDSTKLKEAFESIAEELKKQYLLGFYPRKTETSRNRVRITVEDGSLIVRTKKKLEN